jgi:4-hydroxy-2-oxoglutarate aldolase
LSYHPNIVGMKDSSGDLEKQAEAIGAVKSGFQVLTGASGSIADALHNGASGAILALANALPYACVTIWEAHRMRDHQAAHDWQSRIVPASRVIASKYGIPGLKYAMDLNGYYGGPPRLPLVPASAQAKAEIEEAFNGLRS